jgi:homoserine O-acetyltransferase
MSDPAWKGGQYGSAASGPQAGMRVARKLGTITYRSAAEWDGRFSRQGIGPVGKKAVEQALKRVPEGFGPRFAVETYLESQAERFVSVFDPNCYLYLSRAMDCYDIAAHGAAPEVYRRSGVARTLVVGVESDFLFAIGEQAQIARDMEAAGIATRFLPLPSIEGHDAFLVDLPRFDAAIRGFLGS